MKYKFTALVTVSCHCEVEANTPEEALKKAQQLTPALHTNGSGMKASSNWLIEDADGSVMDITPE